VFRALSAELPSVSDDYLSALAQATINSPSWTLRGAAWPRGTRTGVALMLAQIFVMDALVHDAATRAFADLARDWLSSESRRDGLLAAVEQLEARRYHADETRRSP
jgi:hypothetical protein